MCLSDLAADICKQRSSVVNTPDMMLQKAAAGSKEETGPQQLLSLTLSSSGLHNTVLKVYITLYRILCVFGYLACAQVPIAAAKVAHYHRGSGRKPS